MANTPPIWQKSMPSPSENPGSATDVNCFDMIEGGKQDGNSFLILFSVLKNATFGININTVSVLGVLAYADDIINGRESEDKLKNIFDILKKWSMKAIGTLYQLKQNQNYLLSTKKT